MKFDIIFDEMKSFEPATQEDAEVFETPIGNLKRRYELAQRMYKNGKLYNVSEVVLRFINHKEKGQATQEIYDKAVEYISKQLDGTINNDGFTGLALADLKEIYGVHST